MTSHVKEIVTILIYIDLPINSIDQKKKFFFLKILENKDVQNVQKKHGKTNPKYYRPKREKWVSVIIFLKGGGGGLQSPLVILVNVKLRMDE